INESVGATALGVAGGRAAETNSADPLINDPFAQLFLDAAGDGIWRMYQDGELPSEMVDLDPQFADRMQAMLGYTACRTKFFDEYFLVSADDGIRQSVVLAAGLDARAWRLDWPAGCVVYEVDQPKVLAFKTATLESRKATPIASHISVGIDLRQDWPTALVECGFDPSAPTAWSAEGTVALFDSRGTGPAFRPCSVAQRRREPGRRGGLHKRILQPRQLRAPGRADGSVSGGGGQAGRQGHRRVRRPAVRGRADGGRRLATRLWLGYHHRDERTRLDGRQQPGRPTRHR